MPTPSLLSAAPSELSVGPAPRFRVVGRSLQMGPRADEFASYRDGQWSSDGRVFAVLESETPTLVQFEGGQLSAPEVFGPFDTVQITNGEVRWGPGIHQVLAVFVEETETWQLALGGKGAGVVVLSPAAVDNEDACFTADDFVRTDDSQSRPDVRSSGSHPGKSRGSRG